MWKSLPLNEGYFKGQENMKMLKISFVGSKQVLKKRGGRAKPLFKKEHTGGRKIWAKKSPTRGGSGKFQILASLR